MEWTYAVVVRQETKEFHAYCAALPEAIASGTTAADALKEMALAIDAAVRGRIKDSMDLEPPCAQRGISLPVRLAAKASIYAAWKRSGMTKTALAEKLGRNEAEVRRILDPDYGTKLDQLADAAAALGGRLAVSFETA